MTKNLADRIRLDGRRVLVTGGAGHVGAAIVSALDGLGAAVAVLDLNSALAAWTPAAASQHPPVCVPCDLTDETGTRAAVRAASERLGGADILVHAAAYVNSMAVPGWAVPFPEQTVPAWDAAMRVNVTSVFVMAQELGAALRASGRGSIILIDSIYGIVGPDPRLYAGTPMVNPAAYGASKGALLQMMRYLATTMAPAVRVNAVSPGGIERAQPEAFQQRYVARTPLARMATEEDVTGAVAYLAGDLSAYVTGHNLVVDGGWTAW